MKSHSFILLFVVFLLVVGTTVLFYRFQLALGGVTNQSILFPRAFNPFAPQAVAGAQTSITNPFAQGGAYNNPFDPTVDALYKNPFE